MGCSAEPSLHSPPTAGLLEVGAPSSPTAESQDVCLISTLCYLKGFMSTFSVGFSSALDTKSRSSHTSWLERDRDCQAWPRAPHLGLHRFPIPGPPPHPTNSSSFYLPHPISPPPPHPSSPPLPPRLFAPGPPPWSHLPYPSLHLERKVALRPHLIPGVGIPGCCQASLSCTLERGTPACSLQLPGHVCYLWSITLVRGLPSFCSAGP